MFAPVSVSVPVPVFVTPPVPLIPPPNVPLPPPLPSVKPFAPSATLLPATPFNAPIVWFAPEALMSSVAPAPARFTAPVPARLPPAPNASVPEFTVVPPV